MKSSEQKSTDIGATMEIEGHIQEVMESWPLQLAVDTNSGRYHVGLQPETRIEIGGVKVDPGDLKPGLTVLIKGTNTGNLSMTANTIEILSE